MADHFVKSSSGWAIISMANIYSYKGLIFEFHNYCGPMRLNKDGNPSKRDFYKSEYKIIDSFCRLSKRQRKKFLISS